MIRKKRQGALYRAGLAKRDRAGRAGIAKRDRAGRAGLAK